MFTHQALKALALVRLQKVEESLLLADDVLATKPIDDGVLTAMMHVLRGLGRRMYLATLIESLSSKIVLMFTQTWTL